jgi:hypothetical protein
MSNIIPTATDKSNLFNIELWIFMKTIKSSLQSPDNYLEIL